MVVKPAGHQDGNDRLDRTIPSEAQPILAEFRNALLGRLPGHIRRLVLFGSRARGDAAPDSDFDIAVVITGHDVRLENGYRPAPFSDPLWQEIVNTACDVALDYDVYISPFVLTEDRLDENSPIVRAITTEGIELWTKN